LLKVMAPDWEDALQDAIHEPDPALAEAKIRAAEAAIFRRIDGFSNVLDPNEQQALFDALGAIRILKSARRL
jgi:hypothetical protein